MRKGHHFRGLGCLVTALLFSLVLLSAITLAARDPATIVARLMGDISTLDPGNVKNVNDMFVATNIYASLVRYIPGTSDIEPDLASSWEVSADGLEFVFHLREGLQFHKGYGPVTADDVKFTFDRIIEGGMVQASYLTAVDTVEVIDDQTVRIRLKAFDSAFLSKLAYRPGFIVSRDAVEALGDDFSLNPVGCGAYEFVSWLPGETVTLKAFEQYHDVQPAIQNVIFRVVTDETAAAFALETGELDIAVVRSQETIDRFKDDPAYDVDVTPGTSIRMLVMNTSRQPFNDVRVRRAVAHAIDRSTLQVILGDTVVVTDQLFTPAFFGYTPDVTIYNYDPATARDLLTAAGYPNGLDVQITSTQLAPWPDLMPVVEQNLRDIGIRATVNYLEHAAYNSWRRDGDYVMTVMPLGRPPHPDFLLAYSFVTPQFPPGGNLSYYDKMDDLVEAARSEIYEDLSRELYQVIQKKLSYDVPVVPIGYQAVVAVMQPDVKGYLPGILNGFWARYLYFED